MDLAQWWTEGQKSTAVAEYFRPTAMVAEVLGNSYGHKKFLNTLAGTPSEKLESGNIQNYQTSIKYGMSSMIRSIR